MQSSVEILNRIEAAVSAVRQQLMDKLHSVAKEQLFEAPTLAAMSKVSSLNQEARSDYGDSEQKLANGSVLTSRSK